VADTPAKSATSPDNASAARSIPVPLPAHGFETLDNIPTGDLGEIGSAEVITRAAVLLMSGAAERLGVVSDSEPTIDLDEARPIINALAGLLDASRTGLGDRGEALVAGLQSLQDAFRSASRYPDPRGEGPGEKYLR
jgi:Domain of unknown function (DUF1844)